MTTAHARRVDAAFVVAAIALVAVALLPGAHATANAIFAAVDVLLLALAAFAAGDAARRFEAGNPARAAWRLAAAALIGFGLGEAIEGSYTVRGATSPFPSAADAPFLLSYPVLIAALFSFLRAYRASGFGEVGRGAALATSAAVFLLGLPLLLPILRAPLPEAERLVSGAYGVLDLVALVPLLLLLRLTWGFRGGSVWQVWAGLLVGLFLTFVGDVLVAYWLIVLGERAEQTAELLDLVSSAVFTLSYLAIARGAVHQRELLRA